MMGRRMAWWRAWLALVATIALMALVAIPPPSAGAASAVADGDAARVLEPVADAHVRHDRPTENFGGEATLQADGEPRTEAYLRFDVPDPAGVVTRATLRLWVVNGSGNGPEVWLSPNVTWVEDEVTWATRPAVDEQLDDADAVDEGAWLEYDVTSAVEGAGSYTLALIADSGDGLDVSSREADENAPELEIETDGDTAVLLAAGDIARCESDGDEQTAAILDGEVGTIAAVGDVVYDAGTPEEFAECYDPSWGRHKDRTKPVPGNHEYLTEGAAGYFDYFGEAAGDPERGYYSYDLGAWHIVALNSGIDISADSEQVAWLQKDLEESAATCTLAYAHFPRFSSGSEHGSRTAMASAYEVLYEHGAEILLGGHDHDYERFAPQAPDGEADEEHGIRQFVIGTGGGHLRPMGEPQPNSEVRESETYGVLRLELEPDGYEWAFLPVAGAEFEDAGSGACHATPGETGRAGGGPLAAALPGTARAWSGSRGARRV